MVVLHSRYYRGTHGVIVVYDVTNGESFANVKRWLHAIEQNCEVVNRILGGLLSSLAYSVVFYFRISDRLFKCHRDGYFD